MKFSKILILFAVLVGSLLVLPHDGEAETGEVYEVGDINLNVRSEPSGTGPVIGQLQKGDQVISFEEKYGWVRTYYAGEEAWVAAHYLTKMSQENQAIKPDKQRLQVTGQSVYIRTGPGTDYAIKSSASAGNTYNMLTKDADWYKIELADGSTGWIASWLTDKPVQENKSSNQKEQKQETTAQEVRGVSTNKNNPLDGYNIVIDAGHGGKDPGAIGIGGVEEKSLTSQTADQVADVLREEGATVIETRVKDTYLSLNRRVEVSNAYNTDAFISIHYNAFPIQTIHGIGAYYSSQNKDLALAENIQNSLASSLPLYNRGLYQEGFHVLRNNDAPSVLLELGFITNRGDVTAIQSAGYNQKVAEAIADGLEDYFY
ncbi:N-acetylmuramoyl-L-alanine amidase [Oceanobacillus kapialis]|uniref:N-acetylmuramoyl-L-alanine amidase n=1 Tax=Oceanobacillus kapialis TaxID=481353 RepID=A0ABW5Q2Z0_9BACI